MKIQKDKPYTRFPFEAILEWYKKNGRHTLPWRQIYHLPIKERLYRVWIAEVMLQQTQVDRVIWYYNRFIEKYPTIESLAETTYEELFPYYQWLGYYSRARRMIELAQYVVEKYEGIFPNDFEKLLKLPWIGTYTAQALLAFWYNQPILAIDANLEKIFSRYYFGAKLQKVQKTKYKVQNEGRWNDWENIVLQLQKQVKTENISGRDINNALMDFWALVSTAFNKVINEDVYPLPECRWFQTQWTLEIKNRESSSLMHLSTKALKYQKYVCLVFLHENHQKYWSSKQEEYEPFLVLPTTRDDRASIQDYFSATYGLEISVRPSFWNGSLIPGFTSLNRGTEVVKLFHAQIQTGTLSLPTFSKQEKEHWLQENLSISEK